VIWTASLLVLVTLMVKVNVPPGAGREAGVGTLETVMVGGTSVMVTTAVSLALACEPSLSTTVTVTSSVWLSPASPMKEPSNWHV
jgi:hypothetical protein